MIDVKVKVWFLESKSLKFGVSCAGLVRLFVIIKDYYGTRPYGFMLDLTKLAQQMQGMSQHINREAEASRKRIEIALGLIEKAKLNDDQLMRD